MAYFQQQPLILTTNVLRSDFGPSSAMDSPRQTLSRAPGEWTLEQLQQPCHYLVTEEDIGFRNYCTFCRHHRIPIGSASK